MRVAERETSQVRAGAAPGGPFGDALRRARGDAGEGDAARVRERRAAARPDARPPARAQRDGEVPSGQDRGGERGGAPGAEPPLPSVRSSGLPVAPELAALARTVPVAIAASRAREGAQLSLSFGPSLDVELRAGAAGVEILLRPDARLARAAVSELPHLVAALRRRGVAVARAEVRPRGGARRPR